MSESAWRSDRRCRSRSPRETQGFAVATGYDSATGQYTGLTLPDEDPVPQLTDSTLLVRPDLARAQREAERATAAAAAAARRDRMTTPLAKSAASSHVHQSGGRCIRTAAVIGKVRGSWPLSVTAPEKGYVRSGCKSPI